MVMSPAENKAYNQGTAGILRMLPILQRNGFHESADRLEVMIAKLKVLIPSIRDTELLNETGCCCGEIRGTRNNRDLCEACEQRAGNGGSL